MKQGGSGSGSVGWEVDSDNSDQQFEFSHGQI